MDLFFEKGSNGECKLDSPLTVFKLVKLDDLSGMRR